MTHPHEDHLLLLAYGELPEADARELETHLAACARCRAQLERLERGRIALDLALRPRRRALRWGAVALAAAAAILVVVMFRPRPETSALSLTLPRYTAPGLAPIDSLLTRLEQEKPHAIP